MPYDPRMLQMAQVGVRMMGPDQRNAFADPRSRPQQPPEMQLLPYASGPGQGQMQTMPYVSGPGQQGQMQPLPYVSPSDPSKPDNPNEPKKPPSLLDMMMGLGRMPPQQYNKGIQSGPPGQQQGAAMVSPWAWLGYLGGGRP